MKSVFYTIKGYALFIALLLFFSLNCHTYGEAPSTDFKPADLTAAPHPVSEKTEKEKEFALFLKTVKTTVVEGEIIERSELPDPKKSDYPNCRFTAHFDGNAIKSGEPCPKELSLIIEGFEDYRILKRNNAIKAGDKVLCTIVPFERLPEDQQSTQQADDLQLFLLESYYVISIQKIQSYDDDPFMPKSGLFFSDEETEYISIFEKHINPPIPQDVIEAQNRAIQRDLQKMNSLLNEYNANKIEEINKRFADVWKNEREKDPDGYNRIGTGIVWRNIDNSFWCLPVKYKILSAPDLLTQESIECFAALKKACETNGVQLIVSLVPNFYVISARVINKEFRDVPDLQTATFVKQLSEIGVETVYSSDAIIQHYNRYPFAFFFPTNTHPSDTTQDVISDILSERLNRYHFEPTLDHDLFSEKKSPHAYGNEEKYLFPQNCDIGENHVGSAYTCREVLYDGKQIAFSKDAPIIAVGNSFQQTPMFYPDSLPTLLSYKLSIAVDWYRVFSYGPFSDIINQILTRTVFFLKNKKVLIFCVGTEHLRTVNSTGTFLNVVLLDNARLLLNNRKMKGHFVLQSNADADQIADPELWGPVSTTEKAVLKIDETGELTSSFNINSALNGVVDSKPVICIVPHTCVINTTCKMTINGITQLMHSPNFAKNSRFFNLAYELPAGTKEITVKIEGKPGTLVAIQDIQIWQ